MPPIFDLHCHSDQSDGILSPEALVSRAKQQEVDVLALTDHDTTKGLARARLQAQSEDIELIAGIEFSSHWHERNIHIVGLNIDEDSDVLRAVVEQQHQRRIQRAQVIAHKLEHVGISGALAGAQAVAGTAVIGRPHFAHYMVASGHCKNVAQAFKKYLGAGKVGDVKSMWPDFEEIVETIERAGGIAVLAHPDKYKMTRTKLCVMVAAFKSVGGRAIEVVSGKQSPKVTNDLATIAARYSLLASCGSDFHMPGQPWQELGQAPTLPVGCEPVWQGW